MEPAIAQIAKRADGILERDHALLFKLKLAVTFHQHRLRTKYWLPLPDSGCGDDEQLLLKLLSNALECLERIDAEVGSRNSNSDLEKVPTPLEHHK